MVSHGDATCDWVSRVPRIVHHQLQVQSTCSRFPRIDYIREFGFERGTYQEAIDILLARWKRCVVMRYDYIRGMTHRAPGSR